MKTRILIAIIILTLPCSLMAKPQTQTRHKSAASSQSDNYAVSKRLAQEAQTNWNPFAIAVFKPNYLLPAYYTGNPYYKVYDSATPDDQNIKKTEVNFQISIKFPIWENIAHSPFSLFAAYTQKSFWQAYTSSPYFRETNYEPEVFVMQSIKMRLKYRWHFRMVEYGLVHQSNGRGGSNERSWNRIYANLIFARDNWLVSIEPWYIIHDKSLRDHNSNISHYLGHGRLVIAYKLYKNTFALKSYNNLESGFSRGTVQLTWSFPLGKKLKGYLLFFNGYGQSLMEYDHKTTSAGIGIALNDWI